MKNITKLGLTALAGSLVASSAFAGAMSVSGSAKITHASQDETEVTGNSFSNSKGLSFSGSGELDNGYTVSTTYTMTNSAFSSSQVTIDMGDMGVVGLWNGANGVVLTNFLMLYQLLVSKCGTTRMLMIMVYRHTITKT